MKSRYDLKESNEKIGKVDLTIATIADLDGAIDKLCDGVPEESAEAVFVQELCPYFGVLWPAARALATHIAKMGDWLHGKTVLEVGCGLALPSLVAAKLGAKVVATDFHPDVPEFLSRNLELNQITPEMLTYKSLDWRAPQAAELGKFDFVIGSDVLYEGAHPGDIAKAIPRFCHKETHVLITDPGRAYLQTFIDALCAQSFRQDTLVARVEDPNANRAGDKKTHEVFVVSFQKV